MKKYLAILSLSVLTLMTSAALAQKGKATTTKATEPTPTKQEQELPNLKTAQIMVDHYARKYSIATRWGDYDVAKDALYDLIAEYPGNDSLIFALAYFYFENQKYPSCAVVCNDLLARNAKNMAALELSAISYENLNIKDRALQSYESLFLMTNNNSNLYKMAALQYDLKRYGESLTNSDILLSKPQADSLTVTFSEASGVSKEYPLKAALHNLKGLCYKAQGDMVNAKKSFEAALKVDPAFEPAKQNMAATK